jgi:hypothetical protein
VLIAAFVATIASVAFLLRVFYRPADSVDFDQVWFGARMLWEGRDPYPLVGPSGLFHWNFHLLYPAQALVAAMPLALLPMRPASVLFTLIGSGLLCYGITKDGWHRIPIFASAAFVDTTLGGQWSSILVAGVFLPSLCAIACAKPQIGFGVVVAANSRRSVLAATIGAVLLGAIGFALVPSWFGEWLAIVRHAEHMKAALFQPGGVLILAVLLRWRRPEAWAIVVLSVLPQTLMWYSFLILLVFPKTYREACVISLISSIGYLLYHIALDKLPYNESTGPILWLIVTCTTYLPVVIGILRKPNLSVTPQGDIAYLAASPSR